jgi:hypothetical protein
MFTEPTEDHDHLKNVANAAKEEGKEGKPPGEPYGHTRKRWSTLSEDVYGGVHG